MRQGTEAPFQQQVTQLARFYGWDLIFHAPDNIPRQTRSGRVVKQHVAPGFPDLVMVRQPELLVVELKAEDGRVSKDQVIWLNALAACGVETHIWKPSDFDELHERLARGRHQLAPLYTVPAPTDGEAA